MASPSADEPDAKDLRRRAELFLQNRAAQGDEPPSAAADMQSQLRELQLHQIELEMQNDELRRSKDAAEAAAARNADFYDFAPLGHVTLDRSGNITQANPALARMLGVERSTLTGSRFGLAVDMDDQLAFAKFFELVFDTGAEQHCELKLASSNAIGQAAAMVLMRAVRSADPLECRIVLFDISERIRLESSLRASQELLTNLSRNVPGVVYQYHRWPDGRRCFPYASEGIVDIFEVTPEQVRADSSTLTDRVHPDDIAAVQAAIIESARTQKLWKQEYRVNLPRQGLRWLSGLARPERLPDGSTLFHGFITDITERKNAEADFHQVMQASEVAIWINNPDERFTFVNHAACKLLGYTFQEYLTMQISDLLTEQEVGDLQPYLDRLKTAPFLRREWKLKRKDGGTTLTEVSSQRLGDDRNLAFGHDVSERKRLELKQAALAAVVEHSDTIIVVKDLDLRVVATNQAFAVAAGYPNADHLIGKTDAEIFSQPADTEAVRSCMSDERLAQALPSGEFLLREEPMHAHGGEVRQLLTKKYPIYSDSGQLIGTGNISTDITELKRAQAQQLSREAALRDTLVREVHHRIENNLQGVMGLLREFGRNHALPDSAIATLMGQVQSVAVIHGLQGKNARQQVHLCELTTAVVDGVGELWQTEIEMTIPQPWVPFPVAQEYAVSIALVINELIQNAVKHRNPPQSPVHVALQKTHEPGAVQISIVNSGQWKGGQAGLQGPGGMGLELIAALLPRHGAQLSQHMESGRVCNVLNLAPPVLESNG